MGSSERCDVTQDYKYREGTLMERTSLGVESDGGTATSDVELDVKFSQQAGIGEDFEVTVLVRDYG